MIPEVSEVSALDTKARLDRGENLRLIDCREEPEFAICRIEGAELIPLSIFAGLAREQLTKLDEPIVIFCHAGVRSAHAAHYLSQLGYTNVRSMAGGIDSWSLDVDPTVARY